MRQIPSILPALWLLAYAPALADTDSCARAPELLALYNGFRALEAAAGPSERRTAGETLAHRARGADVLRLSSRLNAAGVPVDTARLARSFAHGAALADLALDGGNMARALGDATHAEQLGHTANVLRRAGCGAGVRTRTPDANATSTATRSDGTLSAADAPPKRSLADVHFAPLLPFLAVFALIGLIGAAVMVWRRSLRFRSAQVERLPRHPVHLPIALDFEDPLRAPGTGIVVDISQGGMKLSNGDNLPQGTRFWIDTPGHDLEISIRATVVWSNPFYCGIVFDQMITPEDMARFQAISDS